MVFKGFPDVVTWGQQHNIGENSTVILYTGINQHVGRPKQNTRNTISLDVQHTWTKSSVLHYSSLIYS